MNALKSDHNFKLHFKKFKGFLNQDRPLDLNKLDIEAFKALTQGIKISLRAQGMHEQANNVALLSNCLIEYIELEGTRLRKNYEKAGKFNYTKQV